MSKYVEIVFIRRREKGLQMFLKNTKYFVNCLDDKVLPYFETTIAVMKNVLVSFSLLSVP